MSFTVDSIKPCCFSLSASRESALIKMGMKASPQKKTLRCFQFWGWATDGSKLLEKENQAYHQRLGQ